MNHETAWKLAQRWVEDFNRYDLEAMLEHYSEDIVFISPTLMRLVGFEQGQLKGKAALRRFFEIGLKTRPNMHFELIEVLVGVQSIAVFYRNEHGMTIIDHAELDERHKIVRAVASYGQAKHDRNVQESTYA